MYIFPVFLELPMLYGILTMLYDYTMLLIIILKYNKTLYEVVNAGIFWSHGRVWQCYTHTDTHTQTYPP